MSEVTQMPVSRQARSAHPDDEPEGTWRPCEDPAKEVDEQAAFNHACPACRLRMGELLLANPRMVVEWQAPGKSEPEPILYRRLCSIVAADWDDPALAMAAAQPLMSSMLDEQMRSVLLDLIWLVNDDNNETVRKAKVLLADRDEQYQRMLR